MFKLKEKVDQFSRGFLVFLMATMVLNVVWQVFTRFILRSPSTFTDELARYLLIWVGLFGAAYITGQKLHLAMDILPSKLKGKPKKYLNFFINLGMASFSFLVLGIGGSRLVYITLYLNQNSPALNIPLGYIYMALPISGLLIIYYSITSLFESPAKENAST